MNSIPPSATFIFSHAWADDGARLALAAAVTLAFALLARSLKSVTWPGAAAGALACFSLFAGIGPVAFLALGLLFAATSLSTRFRYARKKALGLAERREGRSAWQVSGNLAAAGVAAAIWSIVGNRAWVVAVFASLCEAANDTIASEVGQSVKGQARMITTWQTVQAGIDGGISLAGTVAGLAAGLAIAIVGRFGRALSLREAAIAASAGFCGMLLDSLLGATLQRRDWISNQGVNLASTTAAAILAWGLCAMFSA